MQLKKYIPKQVKQIIKKKLFASKKKAPAKDKWCTVCQKNTYFKPFPYHRYFKKYYEHGFVYSPFLFETLNLDSYHCALCGANDRDRLIALYLTRNKAMFSDKEVKVLDFAPVKALQQFLKQQPFINYRSADLLDETVDDKVDMTHMDIYTDEQFDVFVCSHILEHIVEDIAAMKELYRITRKGGFGMCLVPIMLSIDKANENEAYRDSESLRWKYFGQGDHVRMYSKNDFVSRFESVGFKVEQVGKDYFDEMLLKFQDWMTSLFYT